MADQRTVKPTSYSTAVTDPIVLRKTNTTRLIFEPTLVENQKTPDASVRGKFRFQRKGPNDAWSDGGQDGALNPKKG